MRPTGPRGQIHLLHQWKDLHQSPLQERNGTGNTQTTSQTASTNWTGQSRSFCSGWEMGITDLMPTCAASSRLASLRCAHAWPQNIYHSTANYLMHWGGTYGQNQYHWGTSFMSAWRSWGGQPLLRGRQAFLSSIRWRWRQHQWPSGQDVHSESEKLQFSHGWVTPVAYKQVVMGLPCHTTIAMGSVQGLVGLVSVCFDWVR